MIDKCGNSAINQIQTIYINPRPSINVTESDDVLCYTNSVNFTISTVNTLSPGSTWRYDVEIIYPADVDGTYGTAGSTVVLSNQTAVGIAVLTDDLTNSGNDVQTVTYTFTPHIDPGDGGAECASGVPVIISIEINPQPRIAVSTDGVLCYDGDAAFDITNLNTVNTTGEWRYDVSVVYPGGVTGDWTGGLTNQTAAGIAALTDDLTNTTNDVQTVTYTFTPHIDPGDGGAECADGVPVIISIEINPQPRMTVSTDEVLCYDGDAAFDITNLNTVNTTGEWRYDVSVVYPGGVTGDWTGGLTNQTAAGIAALTDDLTNTTNDVQTVIYTFTPHIDPGDGGAECAGGVPVIISIEINPQPRIAVSTDGVLCYDGDAAFDITNLNTVNTTGEWRYDVSVVYPGGVTGDWTGGLTNQTAAGIAALTDDLTNTTNDVQTVTYTFTPHIDPGDGGAECADGVPVIISIEINPQPRMTVNTDGVLCYDGDAAFDITNLNTVNTIGTWRYDVSVVYPGGVTGDWTGGLTNQTAAGIAALTDDLTNTTNDVQTVIYTFTPHIDPGDGGAECADGVPVVISIEINPQPRIAVTADEVLCYDGDASFDITNMNTVNTTGEWRYDVEIIYPADVDGTYGTAGSTVVLSNQTAVGIAALTDDLTNSGNDVQTVTYTFTPHIDPGDGGAECASGVPVIISIEINPQPRIAVNTDGVLCYDGDAAFDITNLNTVNTIGTWRYDVSVVYPGGVTGDWTGGLTNQTAAGIAALTDDLTNTTNDVQTVTYTFTPHIDPGDGGAECADGVPVIISIEINPQPRIAVTADEVLCYDGDASFDITNMNTVNTTGEWRYDVEIIHPADVDGTYGTAGSTVVLSNQTAVGIAALTDDLTNSA